MKLKVGDKVRVRKDLEYKNYISSNGECNEKVMRDMLNYKGEIVEIVSINENGYIEINECDWYWVDTMFEEIIANKVPKLKPGMAVHCDTEEKSKIFLQECERQGVTRCDRDIATNLNAWNDLKENTCYSIRPGRVGAKSIPYLGYCGLQYYKNRSEYNVVKFDDLFKECQLNNKKVENIAKYRKTKYEVIYERPDFIHDDVEKVMTNNNTTIVILKTGEKGIAKCSVCDDFNLLIGYELARHRARVKHFKKMIVEEECKIKYLERGDF